MGRPRLLFTSLAAAAALGLALPAAAQFSDSFNFLKAVKDRNGEDAMTYLNKPGAPAVNARDGSSGDTALHIVIRRHDMTWLAFLLSKGADPALKSREGVTPLLLAAQLGDADAARLLLEVGANPNATNSSGETPLIMAVHNRDVAMVRLLVQNRANVATQDTIAGKSARDYAMEDRRGAAVLKVLDEAPKTAKPATVSGPTR